nr:MAG TPA: hypothetical protein [Caudoviricetes sp.]
MRHHALPTRRLPDTRRRIHGRHRPHHGRGHPPRGRRNHRRPGGGITGASSLGPVLAILAIDAGIPPWDAREKLTLEDAHAILDLLNERAHAQKG